MQALLRLVSTGLLLVAVGLLPGGTLAGTGAGTGAGIGAGTGAGVTAGPKVGRPAPLFSGVDSRGERLDLAALQGRTVVLEWSNHECPFVRKHYSAGNMQRQQQVATRQGVVWLTIISSAPGKEGYVTAARAERLGVERGAAPSRVILDPTGRIGRLYRARTTPQMFIIDPEGVLRYMGGIDSIQSADPADIPPATQYVSVALEELAAGSAVTTAVTRPYGCSVKY